MWVPAGTVHDVAALGPGTMYCAYLRAGIDRADFSAPRRVEMTELIRGLLGHLSQNIATEAGLRARGVLLDAIEASSAALPSVRFPTHPVARAIAEVVVSNPARRVTLAEAAEAHGISPRTVRRIFLSETGRSFQQWSTAARLAESLDLLRGGGSLDEVAQAVGFSGASSLVSAFRNHFGITPGRFGAGRAARSSEPVGDSYHGRDHSRPTLALDKRP